MYLPDTSTSADACAEDCPSSIPPAGSGTPIAVSGSADNESNASAGTADNPAMRAWRWAVMPPTDPTGKRSRPPRLARSRARRPRQPARIGPGIRRATGGGRAARQLRSGAAAFGDYRSACRSLCGQWCSVGAAAVTRWRRGCVSGGAASSPLISVGVLDAATDGQDSAAATDRSARGPANDGSVSGEGPFPDPVPEGSARVFHKCRDSQRADSAIGRRLRRPSTFVKPQNHVIWKIIDGDILRMAPCW